MTINQTVAAGAIAGAVNSVMASPIELFKIRMQSQYGAGTDQKLRQVASQLWKDHGFKRGIMRGFWVTVARETPGYACFYGAFTKTKQEFQKRQKTNESLPVWCLMASGSVGGICLWLACYPFGEYHLYLPSRLCSLFAPLQTFSNLEFNSRLIHWDRVILPLNLDNWLESTVIKYYFEDCLLLY